MNIVHVVTYISPDGAFGGPVRVALGQAAELASQGHKVTVLAGSPAGHAVDRIQDGYRLRTFRARRLHQGLGFAGMFAPGLRTALKRLLPGADAVHIHLARDLVTLPAARTTRKTGARLVLQTHGMIDSSKNLLAGPVDAWETRPALRAAAAVLVLTDKEESDVAAVAPEARVRRVVNGMSLRRLPSYRHRAPLVLFLARLHPRKRATAFIDMATDLIDRGSRAYFVLAGPDEGDGDAVARAIKHAGTDRITWIGPVAPDETARLLRRARVYVLPSIGEVFPMTILEALSLGTPVVTTTTLGMAELCTRHDAAILTDGSPGHLADAVQQILSDEQVANRLRAGGVSLLESELSIARVVDDLLVIYAGSPALSAGGASL